MVSIVQGCLPVTTIIFRIVGEEVADLLYADTNIDLRRRKLLQIAMLALQLDLSQVSLPEANPVICLPNSKVTLPSIAYSGFAAF